MDTTEVGGKERGYDAAKNVSGRKRHIVVDTLGLIMAVVIHAADIQDQHGAKLAIALLERFHRLKVIFADSAYKRCGLPDWVATVFGWPALDKYSTAGVEAGRRERICDFAEALDCGADICVDM